MNARASGVAGPLPGSIHYFVELYAPPAARGPLRSAHALEAEIRASLKADLDHVVAHARLEWWREEAARAALGRASHPLLRALLERADAAVAAATLADWVQAARVELAGQRADVALRAEHARRAGGAGFALYAAVLAANVAAARELGSSLAELYPAVPAAPPAMDPRAGGRRAALEAVGAIAPRDQPALRPLLVWAALALRRAARGATGAPHAPGPASLALLADNLHAWRAARAADAGRIHRLLEVARA
jgi:hypothetical protein